MLRQLTHPLIVFGVGLFFLLNQHYPAWFFSAYNSYDLRRLLQLLILGLLALWLMLQWRAQQALLTSFFQLPAMARILLAGFFTLGIISSLLAPMPEQALLYVALYTLLTYLIFFIASQRVALGVRADKVLLWALFISIVFYVFLSIENYVFAVLHIGLKASLLAMMYSNIIYPDFVNVRFLNQFQALTLPLIVLPLFLCRDKNYLVRLALFIVAAYWWGLAVSSASSATWLDVIVVGLVLGICFGKKIWPWLKLQLLSMLGGGVIYFALFKIFHPRDLASLFTVWDRLSLWHAGWTMIWQHPLLGVGPHHFAYYPNNIAAHPHNSVILIAAEWGLPAAAILLALIAWGITRWIKTLRVQLTQNANPELHVQMIALTAAGVAGLSDSLVSGLIVSSLSQTMLCIVVGWMLGCYQSFKPARTTLGSVNTFSTLASTLILFICLMVIGHTILPTILELPQVEAAWGIDHRIFNPNFWIQGWLR